MQRIREDFDEEKFYLQRDIYFDENLPNPIQSNY